MAAFDLSSSITGTPVAHQNASTEYTPSTATPFVTPAFQAVIRATTGGTPVNHNIPAEDPITSSVRGWLIGRRPASGMLYPRGVYNK